MEYIKVSTEELAMGMYVSELDRPWTETPFMFQGFLIHEEQQISRLRKYCEFVYVDEAQGKRPSPSPSPVTGDPKPRPTQPKLPLPKPSASYQDILPVEEELQSAKQAKVAVTDAVGSFMKATRHDAAPDLSNVRRALAEMEESVLRNPDAFMLLRRLKTKDTYAYAHCIDTSMLSMAFGRQLGLPREQIRALGLGAILADVGKMKLPTRLLTKQSDLSDEEFEVLRGHVGHGMEIIRTLRDVPKDSITIVATHHERLDGSGYPTGLAGAKIPLFGRMVGIADTFDAMTSDRAYAPASSPHNVVKMLYELRGTAFQDELVEQFIQMLGIYPVGSVVELSTGEVGIIIGQNRVRRLRPKLMLILDEEKQPLDMMPIRDLMVETATADGREIHITRTVEPGEYGLDPSDYYI